MVYQYNLFNSDYLGRFGFIDGKLVYFQIRTLYDGFYTLNKTEQQQFMTKLQKFTDDMNEKSGPTLKCFVST